MSQDVRVQVSPTAPIVKVIQTKIHKSILPLGGTRARTSMLELRPTCENCNEALPPESRDAFICSYECTYCRKCVEAILKNVCPNCGGGFSPRPIRPKINWKNDNFLGNDPASTVVKHRPLDIALHDQLVASIGNTPPEKR